MRSAWMIIFGAAALFASANVAAKTYENSEFGMTVNIPDDLPTCLADKSKDHGPDIFLDRNDNRGCADLQQRRAIWIFAFFNALDETANLKDFLKWECSQVLNGKCTKAAEGLQIGDAISAAARVDHPNGWIDLVVVTQGQEHSNTSHTDTAPTVNYSITLHTTSSKYENDLREFRKLIRTMQISSTLPTRGSRK
jgi:hypothetical protein